MTASILKHFSKPEILKSLAPESFLALLRPHKEFFCNHGILLPEAGGRFRPDYQRLGELFLASESGVPEDLIEALFLIDGMATPDGMDLLLQVMPQVHPTFQHWTPYDVAVECWVADRNTFERIFAEHQVRKRSRSFMAFRSDGQLPVIENIARVVPKLERELDGHFQNRGRGKGTLVMTIPKQNGAWFLIRHGEPLKREGCLKEGESSSIVFRPERFDAVIFDAEKSELQVSGTSRWQRELYRRLFSKHYFGNEECFPNDEKYTLEPLVTDGEAALNCLDVAGMRAIRLVKLTWCRHGKHGMVTTKECPDLFAAVRDAECEIPDGVVYTSAQFEIHFTGSRSTRRVTINPPNIVKYTFDGDGACVEEWLTKRGFVISTRSENDELTEDGQILACA